MMSHTPPTCTGVKSIPNFSARESNCHFDSRPFFCHNLCCKCSNESCEPILNIYTSISFWWDKELFNVRCFDPCNCFMKFWESQQTPKFPFQECESSSSHFLKIGVATIWVIKIQKIGLLKPPYFLCCFCLCKMYGICIPMVVLGSKLLCKWVELQVWMVCTRFMKFYVV
jgi:hypothetical protein